MRLQKFLSAAGVCSRRQGEKYIQDARVQVNGVVVTELGSKVDPSADQIKVDGKVVEIEQDLIYLALNKPPEVVTSCQQAGEKLVVDLIDIPQRVYPVGRLDKDSTGLLILTNDGRLHHRLSHPSFDHEKAYDVTVARPITGNALTSLAKGLPMMGTKTRPAEVTRISDRRFRIVLKEGKNRQIRRMAGKLGYQVTGLKRVRVANVKLGRLKQGAWRYLTEKEKKELLKDIG